MKVSIDILLVLLSLLISLSAIYNAYLLRGGKLAWSEVLLAVGMMGIMFSLITEQFLSNPELFAGSTVSDFQMLVGFIILLLASLRLRAFIK